MAIRWSAKGRRFYDDQTGYPVTKTRGFRSSIGRSTYKKAHRKRIKSHRKISVKRRYPESYEVRPLSEEFTEEIEAFDGATKAQTMNRYADALADQEPDVYEQEDRYSED